MADLTDFEVLRAHEGDKPYAVGDTRSAVAAEVSHLLGTTLRAKRVAAPVKAKGK